MDNLPAVSPLRRSRVQHRTIGVIALGWALLATLTAAPAVGQGTAAISVTPGAATPGSTVTVTGSGFATGPVTIHLDSVSASTQVAAGTIMARGSFVLRFVAPRLGQGDHNVFACRDRQTNNTCRELATNELTILEPPEPTPTPQPRPTATPTATATATPEPRPTATATPDPRPTATVTPLPTATPPRPPATPTPPVVGAPSPRPTASPTPAATPPFGANPTPAPTASPTPVIEIQPSPTAEVGVLLTPTPTPELDVQADIPIGPEPTADPNPGSVAVLPTPTEAPDFAAPVVESHDLYVRSIEVTQGIQDLDSRMPLIENRRTWVRVHPGVIGEGSVVAVNAALLLQQEGRPDTVLEPVNADITAGPGVDRTDLDAALNFEIPAQWLTGRLDITAAIWSIDPVTIQSEPFPDNNTATQVARFQEIVEPSLLLVGVNDGDGPGPDHTFFSLVSAYGVIMNDLIEFHPVALPDITIHPVPIEPGPFASTDPGSYDLTVATGRHEPNFRLGWMEDALGIGGNAEGATQIMGIFDSSIPADGYTGWASQGASWSKPNPGTPAHEFGHNRGLNHVGCRDIETIDDEGVETPGADGIPDELKGGALDPSHPNQFPNCSLAPIDTEGYFGFTTYRPTIEIYSNDPSHPQAAFPFMSYMGAPWTDPYHWCRLITSYGGSCVPAEIGLPPIAPVNPTVVDCSPDPGSGFGLDLCVQADLPQIPDSSADPGDVVLAIPADPAQWVLISGTVTGEGTAQIGASRVVDQPTRAMLNSYEEHLAAVRRGDSQTRTVITAVDAGGELTAAVPVAIVHGPGAADGSDRAFFQILPWPTGATTIEILTNGRPVATKARSETAPNVSAVTLVVTGGAASISWTGGDTDGDTLVYDVRWRSDSGAWIPITTTTETAARIADTSLLPGGRVEVEVVAGDGFRSTGATSAPMTLDLRDPVTAIVSPVDGASVAQHRPLDLRALAQDPEDGLLENGSVTWSSDVDGDLGDGRGLTLSWLSVGSHRLTVRAIDADGGSAEHSVEITVVASTDDVIDTDEAALAPFGNPRDIDGPVGDDEVAAAPVGPGRSDSAPIAVLVTVALAGALLAAGAMAGLRRLNQNR